MNQSVTNTRKFRFMVDKSNKVVVGTANYSMGDGVLGDQYEFRTIEVPRTIAFDPGRVVGFIITEGNTFIDPSEDFIGYDWDNLREVRDRELMATDWTQVPDAPLEAARVIEFSVWRQQLRDLPQSTQDLDEARSMLKVLLDTKP